MSPFVRLALALLAGALLTACGQELQAQSAEPTPTTEPTATTPPATAAPQPSPVGAVALVSDTAATWDPTSAAFPSLVLTAGTVYTYAGEQLGGWCRLVLVDGAQPWVPCVVIGVTPAAAAPLPTAAPVAPAAPAWSAPIIPAEPPASEPVALPAEAPLPTTPAPAAACASFMFAYSDGRTHIGCGATQDAQRADAAAKATAVAGGR